MKITIRDINIYFYELSKDKYIPNVSAIPINRKVVFYLCIGFDVSKGI